MTKTLRLTATIGLAIAASSLLGHVTPARAVCVGTALCLETNADPIARERQVVDTVGQLVERHGGGALPGVGDACQGLGGVTVGPIPAPTPGVKPEDQANAAIQRASDVGGDVSQGLGGVTVGPIPAPTPGVRPDEIVNAAIQRAGKAVGNVAQGLGGVTVGPIPAPTPGVKPGGLVELELSRTLRAVGDECERRTSVEGAAKG